MYSCMQTTCDKKKGHLEHKQKAQKGQQKSEGKSLSYTNIPAMMMIL